MILIDRHERSGHLDATLATSVISPGSLYHSAAVVEKVVEYLTFKNAYISIGPKEELPDFAAERLPPELALEL